MAEVPESLRAALAGRYALERELGHGGMATVYLATDLKQRRHVAVKVLTPELAVAVRVERFQREIEIAGRLTHPHILTVHDSGEAGGFLYYVMPHIEGESLYDRLEREKQLPLSDALAIAREVADALGYAHAQGFVHRDIKPGNILLSAGHAVVADFGIARAITEAAPAERLTATEVTLGTPAYMSPEQASGAEHLDGRSDIYALGCVVYEMLAGTPPFTGPTTQAILSRQILDPVPPLRTVRRAVPPGVERAILRALEKAPADRFQTAGELRETLEAGQLKPEPLWRRTLETVRRHARLAASLGAAAILSAVWIAGGGPARLFGEANDAGSLDTSRYVVLPFEYQGVSPINEGQRLHDALTWWSGITVVDPFQTQDALTRHGGAVMSTQQARRIAAGLGAGRFVRGVVSSAGDSIRVYATLYDATRPGVVVHEGSMKIAPDLAHADSMFARLGDVLLFGQVRPGERPDVGTRSFPARQAFVRGHGAVDDWDLAAADTAFSIATRLDPDYARAHLWLAQVRWWNGSPVATWSSAAERAAGGRAKLSVRDGVLSDALLALGRGEVPRACSIWGALTHSEPHDFTAWYGLATCLTRDSTVIRDPASPSGWRFRASYHHALRSYQRAFQLLPSIHRSLRDNAFRAVRRLLLTDVNAVLKGRALPPDTTTFIGRPSWEGDSLVLILYPFRAVSEARLGARPLRHAVALRQQRRLFHEIATAWTAAYPESADAVEAVAVALDLLGDPACLDTLRRARALASTHDQRVRLAGNQVWLQLKFSLPSDILGVRAARVLADSVLRMGRPPGVMRLLASLAVLTGRAGLAASLSREGSEEWRAPGAIARTAPSLLIYATLGGPRDSLRALERQVAGTIENVMAAPEREPARMEWLARPAVLAFPAYRLQSITQLAGNGDYLVDAQAAYVRGDTIPIRRMFANLRVVRQPFAPHDLMLDGLYPEAWLLAALGEDREAVEWLDPTLNALAGTAPEVFTSPARAGALVHATRLRAELADRLGDRETARRWALPVVILWSDADAFLQPLVGRMEQLLR